MRQEDTVARLGGDEFALLLPYQANRTEAMRSASLTAEKIMQAFREPVTLGTGDTFVTLSIGIVLYPQDGNDVDELLENADAAMYHAKMAGRSGYHFYSEEMNTVIRHRVLVEASLRRALNRDELRLYYQPLVELSTGDIIGAEGPRIPDSTSAQKDFRSATVIVHLPGQTPASSSVNEVLGIMDDFGAEWPRNTLGRGTMGVIAMQTSDRNGRLVGAVQVFGGDELMLISNQGTLVRTRTDEVSILGRNTQGVRVIRTKEGEHLVGVERIEEPDEDAGVDASEDQS